MRFIDGKSILDHTIQEVKEIKKQLDDSGIKLSAIGSYLGKEKITEPFTHAEKLKFTTEIAGVLDVKNVRMFSFFLPKNQDPSNFKEEVFKRMNSFLSIVKETDIKLLHENEHEIFGDSAERCLELFQEFHGPNFGLIFDTGNFVYCGFEAFPTSWNLLKNHVDYFHIKDVKKNTHEMRVPGEGDAKIPEILSELKTRDGDFFLSLEPHLGNFAGFSSLTNDLDELPASDNIKSFVNAKKSLDAILSTL